MDIPKRSFFQRLSAFYQWNIRTRLTRAYRIFGPRFQSVSVRGVSIQLLVSSDIEQYRLDSYSDKEPETLDWIDQKITAGTVFYDIGANIGLYSLYAAAKNPEANVYAFEPEAQNHAHLCQNIFINNFTHVTPCALAVGPAEELSTFHISTMDAGSALHSLYTPNQLRVGGARSVFRQKVYATSLNSLTGKLGLPFPQCIKLDVDGLEYEILGGANQLFTNSTLRTILLEVTGDFSNPDSEAARVTALLEPYGFGIEKTGGDMLNGSRELVRNTIFSR